MRAAQPAYDRPHHSLSAGAYFLNKHPILSISFSPPLLEHLILQSLHFRRITETELKPKWTTIIKAHNQFSVNLINYLCSLLQTCKRKHKSTRKHKTNTNLTNKNADLCFGDNWTGCWFCFSWGRNCRINKFGFGGGHSGGDERRFFAYKYCVRTRKKKKNVLFNDKF